MEEYMYECVVHGPIPTEEVEFEPHTEGQVVKDPTIEPMEAFTPQRRWHKGCGKAVIKAN